MLGRKVASNGIIGLSFVNILNGALTLLFYFFVSRISTPEILNEVSYFFVSYSIFSVISGLSLNINAVNNISFRSDKKGMYGEGYIANAMRATTFFSLLPSILLVFLIFWVNHSVTFYFPLAAGILSGAASNYSRLLLVYHYSLMSRFRSGLAFFMVFPLPRVLSIVLFFSVSMSYGIELGFLVGSAAAAFSLLPGGILKATKSKIASFLKESLPLYFLSLIGLAQEWAGTLAMIFVLPGSYLIGRYFIFNALNVFVVSITTQVFLGLFPVLVKRGVFKRDSNFDATLHHLELVLGVIILSFVLVVAAESPLISTLLFKENTPFLNLTLVILSVSAFFAAFGGMYVNSYGFSTYLIISQNRNRSILLIGSASVGGFIILFLITSAISLGIIGIPISFLAMNLISFALIRNIYRKSGGNFMPLNFKTAVYAVSLFAVMYLTVYETLNMTIYSSISISFVVLLTSAVGLFALIRPVEINEVKEVLRSLTKNPAASD